MKFSKILKNRFNSNLVFPGSMYLQHTQDRTWRKIAVLLSYPA